MPAEPLASSPLADAEPPAGCTLCPRLAAFREENRRQYPSFFNGAVPSFGDPAARLLVVGLAPGLKGANRTKRPFTGDYAGEILYPTLIEFGLARGTFRADSEDGLTLVDSMVTNAVRCVPPKNKPIGAEIANCRPFLAARIAALPRLRSVLLLGRIAHDSAIAALGGRPSRYPFAHARRHFLGGYVLVDSYHCSRYNMNTRRLTLDMFREAVRIAVTSMDMDEEGGHPHEREP